MNTMRSPKNKYQGVVNFDKAIKEIGSVVRYTSNDIESLKSLCNAQAGMHACKVTIMENMATYPSFDWQVVETYNLNK